MSTLAREFVVTPEGVVVLVEMTDAMSEAMDILHQHAGHYPEDIVRLLHAAETRGDDPRRFVRKLIRLAGSVG